MKIDVYSHTIKVTDVLNERDLQAMLSFCKPLIEMGLEKKGKRFIPKGLRTYAAATRDRKEFSFHRNQLNDLKRHLFRMCGYAEHLVPIVHHVVKIEDIPKVKFDVRHMFPPREKQVGIIDYVLDTENPNWDPIIKMVTLQTGGGKALRSDTPVMTPTGWRRIDKLLVGSEVMARDGTYAKVIGTYPQGRLQLYRFTFEDGRSVDACLDHLWSVCEDETYSTVSTETIIEKMRDSTVSLSIPLLEPTNVADIDLPINPFLYGCLLTTGRISKNVLNMECIQFRTALLGPVTRDLPSGFVLKHKNDEYGSWTTITTAEKGMDNWIHRIILENELVDPYPPVREINQQYLYASPAQRYELLKAIILTGGKVKGVRGSKYLAFRSPSDRLLDDVVRLTRSLGGKAEVVIREVLAGKGENRRVVKTYPEVAIYLNDSSSICEAGGFNFEGVENPKPNWSLKIKSVEMIDIDEAVCIEIDHPEKLFVTKDYIVTHNTYVAQYCMNELKVRTIIHFKGGYVSRWKDDLEKTFKFTRGDFFVVRGTKDMVALQQMALDGDLKAQVIIITSATMRDYIKNYEESNGRSKIYPIKPIDFYPMLNVGFRVTDELHQEFHNNFRIDLYTHVPRSLGLSATMTSSDAFKNRVYDIGYPVNQRHDGGGYNVYIDVTAVMYHMDQDVRVRHMGAQGYSHTTYEESIMRHKGLLKSYLKIIDDAIYSRYVSVREEGQKALVFFARVDLCTLMMERLKKMYPEFNIVRYVGSEGDSYEELLEADIGVTTIGSGGTAIDITNLRTSFMTTAIDSRQSNEQVLGRTRPLKDWPDISPEFVYFTCLEIEQHCKYHRNKRDFFHGKVLSHNEVISRYVLEIP